MRVTELETACFRNLATQEIALHPRFNVLVGENGQGKTNFLEAVYVAACFESFRAIHSSEMVRFGETSARVRAFVAGERGRRELEVRLEARGKRGLVDGKRVGPSAGYLDHLKVVLFWPEDLRVPRGAPVERRRLIDRAIASVWPLYRQLARDYQKTVGSRNRVLRQGGGRLEELLEVYDKQVAEIGSRIVAARVRYLSALEASFEEAFERICQSGVKGRLRYLSGEAVREAGEGVKEIEEVLGRELRSGRARDLARGLTSVGPHVDDLEFEIGGRTTRAFGSQGQVRALVLAFKLAQIADVMRRTGEHPVLLLDDVSSELDPPRTNYLFDFINEIPCQCVLTTTRPDILPVPGESIIFQMVEGKAVGDRRA